MLFLIAAILAAISIYLLFNKPYYGLLFTLASKSVIDATWNTTFAGFNLQSIIAVAMLGVFLPKIVPKISKLKTWGVWKKTGRLYFWATSLAFLVMPFLTGRLSSLPVFFKTLSGFLGFFLLVYYIDDKAKFKQLLIVLIISGIFPTLVGLYQAQTGAILQHRTTVGFVRYVGFYHDVVTLRFYESQTLLAMLLYWHYFLPRKLLTKLALIGFATAIFITLYFAYSKAATAVVAIWGVLWAVLSRKPYLVVIFFFVFITINSLMDNQMLESLTTVFSKEIEYREGELDDEKRLLQGRGYYWENAMDVWRSHGFFFRFFGTSVNFPAHNEFVRVLVSNGILGLILYSIVVINVLFALIRLYRKHRSVLTITAILIFAMYMIDGVGVTPGIYPSYQWFVWGMLGLAFSRLNFELSPKKKRVNKRKMNAQRMPVSEIRA